MKAALILGVVSISGWAHALPGDLATKFRVNDDDPMASVPTLEQRNADPLEFGYYLQDMIARAELAFNEKNWARAIRYYEPLARAVPDRAVTFSRLCASYSEIGNIDAAVNACSNAVHLQGALVLDHFRFINLVLKKQELSSRDITEVDASLAHLRAHVASHEGPARAGRTEANGTPPPAASSGAGASKPSREEILQRFMQMQTDRMLGRAESGKVAKINLSVETEVLACKVGVRLRSAERLDTCVQTVRGLKLHPTMLLPFEWARALVHKDEKRAAALLEEARKTGLPPATLASMAEEQRKALAGAGFFGIVERWGLIGVIGLAVIALLGLGAVRFGSALRRSKPETATSPS